MKTDHLLDRLFDAARSEGAPDTSAAEYGFETRLLARLREERGESIAWWARRLCPYFALLTVAAGLWSQSTRGQAPVDAAVLVETASRIEQDMLAAYLPGDRR